MKIKNINRINRLRKEVLLMYAIYVRDRYCFNNECKIENFTCGHCAYCLADEALEGDWGKE